MRLASVYSYTACVKPLEKTAGEAMKKYEEKINYFKR
jgi:hypothetical protein